MEARLLRVRGRVQRVGFRRYALDLAQELGLAGYAKNVADGSVEILVQGPRERVSKFLELIRSPPLGEVREVQVREVQPDPSVAEFRIVYGELGEELQEGFGAMQAVFMQYWSEFRDFRQEFRKEMRDLRQEMSELKSEVGGLRQELRDFRQEFAEFRGEFRDFRQEFAEFKSGSLSLSREILSEVRGVRGDLRALLEERLVRIESDVAKIKAKLGLT